jgi:hypothetical protein
VTLGSAANGMSYQATADDDDSLALVHVCEIGGTWDDEVERMRSAIELARRPRCARAERSGSSST